GNAVYPSYSNGAAPSCPSGSVTAVWSIYIDASYLTAGTYSFVVGAAMDYKDCTNGGVFANTTFTVPLPPAAFTITKRAEGTTAAPNGMILFDIDYSFVNTNNFIISDAVPANTSFV